MKQIASPFQFFADRSGDPLDAGYIYIGAVNQNPETTPIAVYWDEAGTQPAAQPFRTVAGYIVNGTTPARVYVNTSDYSMTIKSKSGTLLSYVASAVSVGTLLEISEGGTGASTAAGARTALGAAESGANNDITSLAALTTVPTVVTTAITNAGTDKVRFSTAVTVATTSGTAHDFTGIPAWAQRITLVFDLVSTSGTDQVGIQLGTSASFVTSGYQGSSAYIGPSLGAALASTIGGGGFTLPLTNASSTRSGKFAIERISGNVWQCSGFIGDTSSGNVIFVAGRRSLSDVLTRLRITTILGSDTFDGGQITMTVEGW